MKTNPMPYQRQGVRKIIHFGGRALLADEPGLGKTLQALLYAYRYPGKRPVIVVCPAIVKYHWEREAKIHLGIRAVALEGRTVPRSIGFLQHHEIIIINYDILGSWLPYLKKLNPQIIVVDECQNIRSRTTLQTKNTRRLCRGVKDVLMLSGGPLESRPAELWPMLNILRRKDYPSFLTFARRYCKPELKPWGWQYKGATHAKELHERMARTLMVRRRKEDVLKELPPKTISVIPLPIKGRMEYSMAENDFLKWMIKTHKGKAKKASKAEALVKRGYLKRLAAQLKKDATHEWIDTWLDQNPGKKIIIFAVHKAIIAELAQRYKGQCVVVDGSVTGRRRQQAIDQFRQDKRTRVFIGNIRAAGTGWNGTVASAVAFVELAWTPMEHIQAADRAHRIGQTRGLMIYFLIGQDTIEQELYYVLHKKQGIVSRILDGRAIQEDFVIFEEMVSLMEARIGRRKRKKRRAA